jgi:hypothetical protein
MSGQGASGPNLSLIALIVVGAVFLIGFYYADRSSSPSQDMAATDSMPAQNAQSAEMQAKIKKHQQAMADDTQGGFSGSMEAYLTHAEQVQAAKELTAKGFSGTGSEYLSGGAKAGRSVEQVNGVTATGQSMDEYLAASDKSKTVEQVDGVTATGQSMDDYLASAKPGSSSSEPSTSSSAKSASQKSSSGDPFSGSIDEYMEKFGG